MNMAAFFLLEKAGQWPERIAIRCRGRGVTYAELIAQAMGMANLLRSRGLQPGDRVMVAMTDCIATHTIILGASLAGMVIVLANDRLLIEDYAEYCHLSRPRLVVATPGHAALSAAAASGVPSLILDDDCLEETLAEQPTEYTPHPAADDDDWIILFTSGTTGHPKGIPHSHHHACLIPRSSGRDFLGLTGDDIVLCSAKVFHAYGSILTLLSPLLVGATAILDPFKPTPETTLRLIETERVTVFGTTPVFCSMLLMALTDKTRLGSLRLCMTAGEALPEGIFLSWKETTGQELWQGYGSTETMSFVIGSRPSDIVPGTAGCAIAPYEVVILDDNHRPVADGIPGQLALRGPSIMRGYLDAPEWTARAFTKDGWYLTGDMGLVENGIYTVLGRTDDMFKAGGLWVSPTRVENALLSHPAVAQCAVTGGAAGPFTLVRGHVVLAAGHEPSEALKADLCNHARSSLPDFMAPAEIVFHPDLPLTASGKVQRYKLRQSANTTP